MKKLAYILGFFAVISFFGCNYQRRTEDPVDIFIMVAEFENVIFIDGYEKNGLYVGYTHFLIPQKNSANCLFIRQGNPNLIERICVDSKRRVKEVVVASRREGRDFYKCNNIKHQKMCILMQGRFDYFYKVLEIDKLVN